MESEELGSAERIATLERQKAELVAALEAALDGLEGELLGVGGKDLSYGLIPFIRRTIDNAKGGAE